MKIVGIAAFVIVVVLVCAWAYYKIKGWRKASKQ